MKKEYRIGQDPQRQDETPVYTVDEKIDEIFGTPVYKTVFRGTKEECQAKLEELTK